jgi:hypothetical protein
MFELVADGAWKGSRIMQMGLFIVRNRQVGRSQVVRVLSEQSVGVFIDFSWQEKSKVDDGGLGAALQVSLLPHKEPQSGRRLKLVISLPLTVYGMPVTYVQRHGPVV